MFEVNNQIIIVDNVETDLITLAKVFLDSGMPCRTLLYDPGFETPLKNVRIAFFDINLTEKTIDLTQKEFDYKKDRTLSSAFNDLAFCLQSYIDKDNGPYALIFWSSNTPLITNFIEYIKDEEKGFSDIPSPVIVSGLDKNEFTNDQEGLRNKINEILGSHSITLLFDFETKAINGASTAINQIYSTIPRKDAWGDSKDFDSNFEKIFSRIAASSAGISHAQKNPDKAVYETLLPILNYNIIKSTRESKWSETLETLKSARLLKDVPSINDFKECLLNTIFHIDSSELPFPLDVRGAVLEINKTEPFFNESFGMKYQDWFTHLMPIEEQKRRRDVRSNSTVIAVEISAACDYSQDKKRLNKYLLGLKTPVIEKNAFGKNNVPQCQLKIDGSFFIGDEFQIWLNLNYVFSALPTDPKLGKPLFILKKELIDMIGNRYANHVSRIGVTIFD